MKFHRSLYLFVLPALVVVLLAGCAIPGGGKSASSSPRSATGEALGIDMVKKPREYIVPVYVEMLERGPMEAYLSTVGNLYPRDQVMLSPEIAGTIEYASAWQEGDLVPAGTLVGTVDSDDLVFGVRDANLRLSAEKNQLGPTKAKLEKAQSDLAFFQKQYDRGAVSKDELERRELAVIDAESALAAVKNGVAAAQSTLDKAEYQLGKSKITTPFAGKLVNKEFLLSARTSQNVEPLIAKNGQKVSPGEALVGLYNDNQMRAEVDVSGKDIGRVRPGQRAKVHVYAEDGIDLEGHVGDISTSIDPTSRAFKVQVLVDNSEGRLSRGMFARVDLVVDERRDALAIPREVVQTRNNRLIVFVVEDATTTLAREREVLPGIENRTHVEIVEGLLEGEPLIVRGAETLKDGTEVKVNRLDEALDPEPDETVSQRS